MGGQGGHRVKLRSLFGITINLQNLKDATAGSALDQISVGSKFISTCVQEFGDSMDHFIFTRFIPSST